MNTFLNNWQNKNILVFIFFSVLALITRIIPHMDNFTAMESIALFGALYYSRKIYALFMPFLLMYIIDFVINNTFARSFFPDVDGVVWFSDYMIYNFVAYVIIALTGMWLLRNPAYPKTIFASILASVIFYLLTNFGVWAGSTSIYPHSMEGLSLCYLAGIPFLKTSLISTLVFSTILYGVYTLVKGTVSKSVLFDKY